MKYKLNLTKNYTLDKNYEDTFCKLQEIVSTSFYDSKYLLFGNYFLTDPPEFIFMAKWVSIGRPMYADVVSTKISAKLYKQDNKTKVSIQTTTNPILFVFLSAFALAILLEIIKYQSINDLKIIFWYVFATILILGIDRFIKNILVASFESNLEI